MLTNAPKGTKDILPDQIHKWHYVEEQWKDICRRGGKMGYMVYGATS